MTCVRNYGDGTIEKRCIATHVREKNREKLELLRKTEEIKLYYASSLPTCSS